MRSILILGTGNPMYGDDSVGYCLVRAMSKCSSFENARVEFIYKTSLTIADTSYLEGRDVIVIVDAGEGLDRDYQLYKVEADMLEGELLEQLSRPIDSHDVSPINIVSAAKSAGLLRGTVFLLLVKPEMLEFGAGLSEKAASRVLAALQGLCRAFREECRLNRGCAESLVGECIGNPLVDLK
ncbi:MAG: hydrogenase maturation protease [Desulfurococcales archaeon]|nr:hydrogenase maturation protease [Desulfurococcales archaeon]